MPIEYNIANGLIGSIVNSLTHSLSHTSATVSFLIKAIQILNGRLRRGDKITSAHTGKTYEVADLGVLSPNEVGIYVCGIEQQFMSLSKCWHCLLASPNGSCRSLWRRSLLAKSDT